MDALSIVHKLNILHDINMDGQNCHPSTLRIAPVWRRCLVEIMSNTFPKCASSNKAGMTGNKSTLGTSYVSSLFCLHMNQFWGIRALIMQTAKQTDASYVPLYQPEINIKQKWISNEVVADTGGLKEVTINLWSMTFYSRSNTDSAAWCSYWPCTVYFLIIVIT